MFYLQCLNQTLIGENLVGAQQKLNVFKLIFHSASKGQILQLKARGNILMSEGFLAKLALLRLSVF